ncbi:MAG: hypothetical protein Q8928_15410 [Bacteroidota bacterium]|nr:hypothetical protein [Bacteroidota bacterium]
MAKSNDNVLTHGLSGKVGDLLVFRVVDGKTIVAKAPSKANREPSEKQVKQQERFEEAVIYGKTVMVTPELKAQYETSVPEGKSVYQVALADFLKAPNIKEVDVTGYTGEVGSIIRVRAIDDFMVKSVQVSIFNSDGSVADQGEAIRLANGVDWLFTAKTLNDDLAGDKIVVKASDLPGNISDSSTSLS